MKKNNYISLLSLIAMFFMSMQTFHYHDSSFSYSELLNHNDKNLLSNNVHKCDICNLNNTEFSITEKTVLINNVFSIDSYTLSCSTYFYKQIYSISNKSPPVV